MTATITITNPILRGMNPDPSWIWDDEFQRIVLVTSTFELVPGLPIYVSERMVGYKLGEFSFTRLFKGHGGMTKDSTALK